MLSNWNVKYSEIPKKLKKMLENPERHQILISNIFLEVLTLIAFRFFYVGSGTNGKILG